MTAKQQWAIVGVVVALMGGGLFTASYFLGDELRPIAVGSTAPDFSAVKIDAAPPALTKLTAYRGNVVLLNLWATWCGPCRQEMPSIEALHKDYKAKGLKVVAVSGDNPNMEKEIREFVKGLNLTFDILYDTSSTILKKYQTTGVPETFILSRDGTIYKKWIGPENWNSPINRQLIDQLLAEK